MTTNIELPQVEEELLALDLDDFAQAYDDVTTGKVDTIRADDLEGTHEVDIISAEVRGSKTKEGDARYPNVVIRLKTPAWTTSLWMPVTLPAKAGPVANRLNTQKLLTIFSGFAGESFTAVQPPSAKEAYTLEDKVAYYQELCGFLAGKKGMATFKMNPGKDGREYPNHSLRPVVA